jgi:hypothetical protein
MRFLRVYEQQIIGDKLWDFNMLAIWVVPVLLWFDVFKSVRPCILGILYCVAGLVALEVMWNWQLLQVKRLKTINH